ncbi:DUF2285 domain-containing protein [Caulobacter vibrioides]|uniref:Transcriptional regulator-like domain-containing protein n=2 Tax=Caulobacter vibrioides TaxID=155892 RepID=Q9A4V9_CAUVC|nr:hypothetical protein CC_2716 [Caulobacter vibrioides CB15]ATC29553.1 hypothetical protein CA607_14675 [Caulobacter vibrioides]AZH13784.1 DUF2285 domain-containing protein [Caulobacter vibrioides]
MRGERVPAGPDLGLNKAMAKPPPAGAAPPLAIAPEDRPGLVSGPALAWEFLRRNPRYRTDYARLRSGAIDVLPAHWGLQAPLDPDARDIDADRIWREGLTPGPAADGARSRRTKPIPRAGASSAGSPPASARCSRRACPGGPQGCRTGA